MDLPWVGRGTPGVAAMGCPLHVRRLRRCRAGGDDGAVGRRTALLAVGEDLHGARDGAQRVASGEPGRSPPRPPARATRSGSVCLAVLTPARGHSVPAGPLVPSRPRACVGGPDTFALFRGAGGQGLWMPSEGRPVGVQAVAILRRQSPPTPANPRAAGPSPTRPTAKSSVWLDLLCALFGLVLLANLLPSRPPSRPCRRRPATTASYFIIPVPPCLLQPPHYINALPLGPSIVPHSPSPSLPLQLSNVHAKVQSRHLVSFLPPRAPTNPCSQARVCRDFTDGFAFPLSVVEALAALSLL